MAKRKISASPRAPKGTRVVIRNRLGRKPPPAGETKRDRFCRIGERRMNEVINKISLLGNLSSPQYECTGEDIDRMKSTIQIALDAAMSRFTPRRKEELPGFSFKPGQDGRGMSH